jgi:Flp pilus assembly protein TadG
MAAMTTGTANRRQRWHPERGAELIEMVVVLPLLLLVMFGIIDFGFMFQRYVVLTNAAMEGARVGILPSYTATDAQNRATSYAGTGGVPGTVTAVATNVTLNEPGGGTWPGIQVEVTHSYNFEYIGPIITLFNGSFSSVNLRARAIMRRQLGS